MGDLPNCPLCGGGMWLLGEQAGGLAVHRRTTPKTAACPLRHCGLTEDALRALAALRKPLTPDEADELHHAISAAAHARADIRHRDTSMGQWVAAWTAIKNALTGRAP